MTITPSRRQRVLQVHSLRQRGLAQRKIGKALDISQATVRADLQLAESHWSRIASAAADDLLLQSLHLLQVRLTLALQRDRVKDNAHLLTPVDYLRAHDAQETRLTALAREIRRTVREVQHRAGQRVDEPDLPEFFQQDEAALETPTSQNLANHTPESLNTTHPNETISSPEREIVPAEAEQENIPPEPAQPAASPTMQDVLNEAVHIYPHLKGRSERQILDFLDQFTSAGTDQPEDPTPIYAEAAG